MFARKKQRAWVVAADMGYGHQRVALPFKDIAKGGIITANEYPGIPASDKKIWDDVYRFYALISRFKTFPVLGDFAFALFDKFQEIKALYPATEVIDTPTLQLRQVYRLMEKREWGKHLVQKLDASPLPFVSTFFTPAYMAEFWGYRGPIYLIVPDTDISRAWAPLQPSKSKIVYCVPTQRAAIRLGRYGVRKEHIAVTGFPLPQELTKRNAPNIRKDLKRRLRVLDPDGEYLVHYKKLVEQYVGKIPQKIVRKHKVVLTFAVGGAGAQGGIAEEIAESLRPLTHTGMIEFHMIAGIHRELAGRFAEHAGRNVFVHAVQSKEQYFSDFSKVLRKTDVLWTKPSELVFYAGLGIPLLIAPPIGSQEECNRSWLLEVGAGIDQKNPELTHQWLPDLIGEGRLAEAAMQGFIEIRKDGVENIKKLLFG